MTKNQISKSTGKMAEIGTAVQTLSDIVACSQSYPNWQRDELRRLCTNGELDDNDIDEFSDNDIVVAVSQDGLVANLAKYTLGQPVLGVTPGGRGSEGILTFIQPGEVHELSGGLTNASTTLEPRTMVEAQLGNGDSLVALNELFVGHRSHQSARYIIRDGGREEFQSSSGVIVSIGTGATGWAKSIMTATHQTQQLSPTDKLAGYFSREPWSSQTSGCRLSSGLVEPPSGLLITSRINDGGAIFADGIEQDFLRFDWGQQVWIKVSDRTVNLVSEVNVNTAKSNCSPQSTNTNSGAV